MPKTYKRTIKDNTEVIEERETKEIIEYHAIKEIEMRVTRMEKQIEELQTEKKHWEDLLKI